MRKWIASFVMVAALVGVGCTHDNDTDHMNKKMAVDACPHCPGVQTANAEGKCPMCGAKAAMSSDMSADVCPKCPGVQHATADGKCSGCGATLAAK